MMTIKPRVVRWLATCLPLAAMTLLMACGGGGGDAAGTPVLGGGSGSTPSTLVDLAIASDSGKSSISNSGSEAMNITVTALGSGNAALIGVAAPVTMEVDAGAIITAAAKETDKTNGTVKATVSLLDRTNRTVKVTVRSGNVSKQFSFDVVDSITGSKVADLSVVVAKTTLPNNDVDGNVITVTALDANRSSLGGTPVSLQVVDTGDAVILNPDKTTTEAGTGQLQRTLKLQNNRTNRTIAIKAVSGTVSRTVSIDIIDPPAGTVLKASDMTLTLSKTSVANSGSESVDIVATAVDANRNAVAGIDVNFLVDSNAVLIPVQPKTDANGQAKAKVVIGSDLSNRRIVVTAVSGTLTRTRFFDVTGAKILATVQKPTLALGEVGSIAYSVVDVNGSGMADIPVSVTGPGTASGQGRTDAQGKWTYSFKGEGGGKMSIIAAGAGASVESAVQVNAAVPDVPAGTAILSATMTVDPIVLKVNSVGSTANRAEVRLLFRGEKNAPIENVRVRVGLGSNSDSTDGVLSVSEDGPPLLSDKNGAVVLSFIAGQRSSATEQVKIHACYARTDTTGTTKDGCAGGGTAISPVALTVVESPVSISIGGDDKIAIGDSGLTYVAKYSVLVVDAAGNPKSDVQISPVVDLLGYAKGQFHWDALNKKWVLDTRMNVSKWDGTPLLDNAGKQVTSSIADFYACPNEDQASANGYRNGTIEDVGGVSEDINSNAQLDPRKSDVAVSLVGSTRTDANGIAVVRIEYPKSLGNWVRFMIKVSAPNVLSPPAWFGRYEERWLPVLAEALSNESAPAFVTSPYGRLGPAIYGTASTGPFTVDNGSIFVAGAGCKTPY